MEHFNDQSFPRYNLPILEAELYRSENVTADPYTIVISNNNTVEANFSVGLLYGGNLSRQCENALQDCETWIAECSGKGVQDCLDATESCNSTCGANTVCDVGCESTCAACISNCTDCNAECSEICSDYSCRVDCDSHQENCSSCAMGLSCLFDCRHHEVESCTAECGLAHVACEAEWKNRCNMDVCIKTNTACYPGWVENCQQVSLGCETAEQLCLTEVEQSCAVSSAACSEGCVEYQSVCVAVCQAGNVTCSGPCISQRDTSQSACSADFQVRLPEQTYLQVLYQL